MNKLENYLLHVTQRQKWMIYGIVVIVIGMLMYNMSMPMTEEIESLQSRIETLEQGIAKDSVNSIKKEIDLRKKDLLRVNEMIEKQKEQTTFLISNLYKIQYAFFNEKELANSLDKILKKSLSLNLNIDFIKNKEVKKEDIAMLLKHKKSIEISGNGGYKEVVSFINHIENLNLLLKFTQIKIEADKDNVKFSLLIDIYGIGL